MTSPTKSVLRWLVGRNTPDAELDRAREALEAIEAQRRAQADLLAAEERITALTGISPNGRRIG